MPEIISGALRLFEAATGWGLILIPSAVTVFCVYLAIRRSVTEDDAQAEKLSRAIKSSIFFGVLGTCISGVIRTILSFF